MSKRNLEYLLLALAFLIPLAILILPIAGYGGIVQALDWHSPFYIFTLQFVLGLLLFIKLRKDFWEWIRDVVFCGTGGFQTRSYSPTIIALIIITAFAVFICLFYIPGQSRVQADESVYLTVAQNLYHNQTAALCSDGVFENGAFQCANAGTIKPRGLSYLYALGIPIFGTDLRWVYNFQTFILFLTLPVFFLGILAWFKSSALALISTVLLANVPIFLYLSRSASIEGLYVFVFALSLLFLKWACDRNSLRHYLLLALTLAFLAQTRSEAVFCLGAFVGVVFWKTKGDRWSPLQNPFPAFLATLSFFSLPVLCTLSVNRDSNLQGGAYSAHGHLFENIITDFKIMALENFHFSNVFYYPYFPYFTWLALFGLIILIILTIKELSLSSLRVKGTAIHRYKFIALFLILLSPQYIILFDAVSADFHLDVQHRFILPILPILSFLGALFICSVVRKLSPITRRFALGIITIAILSNTLLYANDFKKQDLYNGNVAISEKIEIDKFLLNIDSKRSLFFTRVPGLFLEKGVSAYNYDILSDVNSEIFMDMQKSYENIFLVENSSCKNSLSVAKMASHGVTRLCDRTLSYFDADTVLKMRLIKNRPEELAIYKIKGLNDKDTKGFLRIMDKIEPNDSIVYLYYKNTKDTNTAWRMKHFVNDSLFNTTPYSRGSFTDTASLSLFDRDTNFWKLEIEDSVSGEQIHSDFWQLVRVRKPK